MHQELTGILTYLSDCSLLKAHPFFSVLFREMFSHPYISFFHLLVIRECGSTLYVRWAHPASPTNTNFQLTFLLTRLSMKTYLYRASNLKSTTIFLEVNFWRPLKTVISCDLFIIIIIIIIIIINFFRQVILECTEANATSLIPFFLRFELLSFVLAVLCGLKWDRWLAHYLMVC